MGPAIVVDNVSVTRQGVLALKDVSIRVRPGEFVGVVGPNGAGKTTLLTLINGMVRPSRGTVTVLGQPPDRGLRRRIGYVPQSQKIPPGMPMSVREAVMVGRYGLIGVGRRPGKPDWRLVDEALGLVGLESLGNRPIGQLSGGEQQRVAIARCLAQSPGILLLDEPTASLDWPGRSQVLELVKLAHSARGLTTILVTHDLACLPSAGDHIILMKSGQVWREGRPDEMLADETLAELYAMPVPAIISRRKEALLGG